MSLILWWGEGQPTQKIKIEKNSNSSRHISSLVHYTGTGLCNPALWGNLLVPVRPGSNCIWKILFFGFAIDDNTTTTLHRHREVYKSQINTFSCHSEFIVCPEAVSTAHLVRTNAKNRLQMRIDPDLVSVQTSVQTGQSNFVKAYTCSYIRVHQVL